LKGIKEREEKEKDALSRRLRFSIITTREGRLGSAPLLTYLMLMKFNFQGMIRIMKE
jgi:hypothetical protein